MRGTTRFKYVDAFIMKHRLNFPIIPVSVETNANQTFILADNTRHVLYDLFTFNNRTCLFQNLLTSVKYGFTPCRTNLSSKILKPFLTDNKVEDIFVS